MEQRNRYLPKGACGRTDLNGLRTIPDFMRGRRIRAIRSFLPQPSSNFIFTMSRWERACRFRSIGKTESARIWRRRRMDLWRDWRRERASKWLDTLGQNQV